MGTENKYVFDNYKGTIYVFAILGNGKQCKYKGKVTTLYSEIDKSYGSTFTFGIDEKDIANSFTPSEFYEY